MRQPPSGTITFLFTDIEGSTRLWEQSPDIMRPALALHDLLMRQAIIENDGYVFKTVGDAFYAAFATAPDALSGALAAQLALVAESWRVETPLRVRMALHTGTAEERDGDYFGPPVNRVARLLAAGHGGQTLLSLAAQELTRDTLPVGAGLRDLGERRLRDLSRPERVFQLLHPSLPPDFPPLKSLDNPDLANNLPQQVSSFIGREKEAAEVKALLAKTRLLTLTGAGGSGKTRLSLQVAADLLTGDGDGVWLVELAALSDPTLIPQAVAGVLGVQEWAGRTVQQSLAEWLKTKRLLLVLDNCEHLITACASLAAEMLRDCPHVRILASSREPLNVAGEQTYRVPSLSLPDPKKTHTVEALSQYEAVGLFIERAQAVQPGFVLTNANVPAVTQVCARLDGIPLALELAAARVRSLAVEEINTRLDNRFRLLTGGSRNALPRQQTLRALVDWSYDLLDEREKTTLQRLSVFAGGWTLSAAESVCAGGDVMDCEFLDLLMALVDKSLVLVETQLGHTRYRLLETVRQYAGDRLAEGGGAGQVQEKHVGWYLALAEEADPQFSSTELLTWCSLLDAEQDNLRTALSWCESEPDRAGIALRLASALSLFWEYRGHWAEGRRRLEAALSQGLVEGETLVRARALNGLGMLAHSQSDFQTARGWFEQSLAIGRALGDLPEQARSFSNLGWTMSNLGEYEAARPYFEQALTKSRGSGKSQEEAMILRGLGRSALSLRDFEGADAYFRQALEVYRSLGDRGREAICITQLGDVAAGQGKYRETSAYYEQSVAISRSCGERRWEAASIARLGALAFRQGEYEKACAFLLEALLIFRTLDDPTLEAETLIPLGNVALNLGDLGTARVYAEQGLAISRALGDRTGEAESLDLLGYVAWAHGEHGEARVHLDQALRLCRTTGDRRGICRVLTRLGMVACGEGDMAGAWALYRESLTLGGQMTLYYAPAFTMEECAALAQAQGRWNRAARLAGAAETMRAAAFTILHALQKPTHERTLAAACFALGSEVFASDWDAGRAMMLGQAVQYALSEED